MHELKSTIGFYYRRWGEKKEVIVAHWKKKILSSNRETESRDAVGAATSLLDLTVSGVGDVEPGEDIKV